ncbi:hypothetical protein OTK59_12125 [Vibrio natriegens]|uniref:hypothetical protein n=1 Tax=Vibrio natriegens TaxID=691 RepID=UPI00228334D5|nr:hypothetical protein [Vibrio natriegens]MCY9877304.1 hypothetical protein [Vibrio natriegens]
MGKCRLCCGESDLQRSHIIPSSLLKSVKSGDSQLYVFEEGKKPAYRNVDPKERLLCRNCEQFLSSNYEQYGTDLLKKPKNVIKHKDCIEFRKFNYKKWYLYNLSILWRASISSLDEFSSIDLGGLNNILRLCVREDNLRLAGCLSVDDFIVITMFRVVDKSSRIEDDALKNIMLSPVQDNDAENILFFFMVNGFLVQFHVSKDGMEKLRDSDVRRTESCRYAQRFVRKLDITESSFLVDRFNWLLDNLKS